MLECSVDSYIQEPRNKKNEYYEIQDEFYVNKQPGKGTCWLIGILSQCEYMNITIIIRLYSENMNM